MNSKEIKEKARKHKKVFVILVVLLIVCGLAYKIIAGRPSEVINDIALRYTGYNGQGIASANEDQVKREIEMILLSRKGINSEDANSIVKEKIPERFKNDMKFVNMLEDIKTQLESVSISINKKNELSNGQQVKVILKTAKDLPVKNGSKVFKVSGLKKTKSYSVNDEIKSMAPKFIGINGYGSVDFNTEREERFYSSTEKNSGDLKNGDEVTYKLLKDYQEELFKKGKILSGSKSITFRVHGLKSMNEIANWNRLATQNLTLAQAAYSGGDAVRYEIEALDTYATVDNKFKSHYSSGTPDYIDKVPESAQFVSFVTVFKITKILLFDSTDPNEVFYTAFGYRDVPYYNGKLHTKALDDMKTSEDARPSLKAVVAEFESANFHAQKVNTK